MADKKTDKKTTSTSNKTTKNNNKISTNKSQTKKKSTTNNKKNTEEPKKTNKNKVKNEEKNIKNVKSKESKELIKEQAKIEIVGKELRDKSKISKESIKKIYQLIIPNIYIAVGIVIYYIFMTLGFYNINNSIFITDIKAFSIAWLFVAIIMFEKTYKKNELKFMFYGIEFLMLAITTMSLIYINLMCQNKYIYVTSINSLVFAVYYIVKSITIYKINKKKYFMDRMKEIIDKDNEEDE